MVIKAFFSIIPKLNPIKNKRLGAEAVLKPQVYYLNAIKG